MNIATSVIKDFLFKEDIDVYLVIFDRESFMVSKKLLFEIQEYIDDNYIGEEDYPCLRMRKRRLEERRSYSLYRDYDSDILPNQTNGRDLDDELKNLDESFSEMLFRLIDQKGMTDVECYKKANVDRKVFSKIRNTKEYRPSKTTAVAFALALELPLDQAKRMIELAGYSLTHNNKFDVIIEYFIKTQEYDIYKINEVLFEFDQKLLGY